MMYYKKGKVSKRFNIRTFVLGANHGQLLQAYGLKLMVEKILPDFVVSHDLYHNCIYKELLSHLKKGALLKMIIMSFCWFKLIKFSYPFTNREITCFGADTIWMKGHPFVPEDEFYFGHDIKSGQLCAFSPSNAGSAFQANDNIVGSQLESFGFIGVRDKPTASFVSSVSSKQAVLTCDPAFFIDEDFYSSKQGDCLKSWISVYALQCKSLKNLDITLVPKKIRGDHIWRVQFYGYFPTIIYSFANQIAGPAKVLENVKNSRLLITDTFHGVVMALMTRTPFLLLSSEIVYNRLKGPLLDVFDKRRIITIDSLNTCLSTSWIYSFDDLDSKKLDNYIQNSRILFKRYLKHSLHQTNKDELQ